MEKNIRIDTFNKTKLTRKYVKTYLHEIILNNYRNFLTLNCSFNKSIILLLGPNGSGKTNILESISLLSGGKGLRGEVKTNIIRLHENSNNTDILNTKEDINQSWSCDYVISSNIGKARINFNFNNIKTKNKQSIYFNDKKISSKELNSIIKVIWLTPQMNDLFITSRTERKKFFERLIYNINSEYLNLFNQYNFLLKERINILLDNKFSSQMNIEGIIGKLEKDIAICSLRIQNILENFISLINSKLDSLKNDLPIAIIKLSNLPIENTIDDEYIKSYTHMLENNRLNDLKSKRSNFGIHKIDFLVKHERKNIAAKLCSTGQQKSMLISIIIAISEIIKDKHNTIPIFLFDEIFVHLDSYHIEYLTNYIINSELQTFISSITTDNIAKIADMAQKVNLENF
ncbi:MAG TPA: AAA family ATPase [Candidatus Megaira endosymbiont of Hartmannula sinica]|nr:AAA family ATPase [Candidatus Megaera endosymbiont of Hartmannula sinica]